MGRSIPLVFLATLMSELVAGAGDKPAPARIVAIAPSTAEVVCSLGACDRIVGVSKFCVYPPELRDRAQVGGLYDPDLEAIIALKPDLLITRGRHDALERLAERLAVPIYHDETDSLEGIEHTIVELGQLLQRPEQAQEVMVKFRKSLADIRTATLGKKRVRVLLTVSRNPDRLGNILTAGRGTFLSEMLDVAGAENVFGDLDMRYPEVSVESIIAKQPDIIIELMPELDLNANHARLREQWKPYTMIPAVRNDRLHFLSDDNALIPSPRYVQFIEKVSRLVQANRTSP